MQHLYKPLLRRIALHNDERAFEHILDHYTPILYPYLVYWLKDIDLVQEVTQDIFLRIWNNRSRLPELTNFAGYLYTIARNRASTVLTKELSRFKNEVPGIQESPDTISGTSLEVKEMAEAIEAAIERLPPKRKEVFKLSRQENLSYEQIAAKLQISTNTVKGHIVSALVQLRTQLRASGDYILLCFLFTRIL